MSQNKVYEYDNDLVKAEDELFQDGTPSQRMRNGIHDEYESEAEYDPPPRVRNGMQDEYENEAE